MTIATVWTACPEAHRAFARWGDQVVVFHRPSGQTHFINSAASELLADLSGRPVDVEALVGRFSGARGLEDPAPVRDYVGGLLLRLEELGLVERLHGADDA